MEKLVQDMYEESRRYIDALSDEERAIFLQRIEELRHEYVLTEEGAIIMAAELAKKGEE
ncbi:TPA_asm: hypothetical protein vir520_00020 [Caudoviricetes sp. vir520]|nr:TPA_asm: hypothetical protein vir520_00020 [Caudoviricetes sp. vir520]